MRCISSKEKRVIEIQRSALGKVMSGGHFGASNSALNRSWWLQCLDGIPDEAKLAARAHQG